MCAATYATGPAGQVASVYAAALLPEGVAGALVRVVPWGPTVKVWPWGLVQV
jgi:hypothetical protein